MLQRINEIYLNVLISFVFTVSMIMYTPALASAPFRFSKTAHS